MYKRKIKNTGYRYDPKLCLIVFSGVLVFQIFIPFCVETENIKPKNHKLVNEIYPAFIWDLDFKGQEKITINMSAQPLIRYDMNFYERVEEDELISFKYSKIERNIVL